MRPGKRKSRLKNNIPYLVRSLLFSCLPQFCSFKRLFSIYCRKIVESEPNGMGEAWKKRLREKMVTICAFVICFDVYFDNIFIKSWKTHHFPIDGKKNFYNNNHNWCVCVPEYSEFPVWIKICFRQQIDSNQNVHMSPAHTLHRAYNCCCICSFQFMHISIQPKNHSIRLNECTWMHLKEVKKAQPNIQQNSQFSFQINLMRSNAWQRKSQFTIRGNVYEYLLFLVVVGVDVAAACSPVNINGKFNFNMNCSSGCREKKYFKL